MRRQRHFVSFFEVLLFHFLFLQLDKTFYKISMILKLETFSKLLEKTKDGNVGIPTTPDKLICDFLALVTSCAGGGIR